ncbi:hypothetical protein H8356DRAFT_1362371 [Neocallimastix lanati (nom. inval.)]|nr:hypothetical protein H8356DRAFT_1362371 [Neocallimastix sp. JGI-2020a]
MIRLRLMTIFQVFFIRDFCGWASICHLTYLFNIFMRKLQEFRYILLNCNLYAFAKGASTYNNGLGYTDLTSKGMLGRPAASISAYAKNIRKCCDYVTTSIFPLTLRGF